MTDIPPLPPSDPQVPLSPSSDAGLVEIEYQTPVATGNAPLLVRLAAIFLLIAAGLDLLHVGYQIFSLVFYYFFMPTLVAPGPGAAVPLFSPSSMNWLLVLTRVMPAVLSLIILCVKVMAGVQLLRRGKNAWRLGLSAGIVSTIEFWTCPCCLFDMGAGIYTIVICCLGHVRAYLSSSVLPSGFEVQQVRP